MDHWIEGLMEQWIEGLMDVEVGFIRHDWAGSGLIIKGLAEGGRRNAERAECGVRNGGQAFHH